MYGGPWDLGLNDHINLLSVAYTQMPRVSLGDFVSEADGPNRWRPLGLSSDQNIHSTRVWPRTKDPHKPIMIPLCGPQRGLGSVVAPCFWEFPS